jgi:hypothetical protein
MLIAPSTVANHDGVIMSTQPLQQNFDGKKLEPMMKEDNNNNDERIEFGQSDFEKRSKE